MLYRIADINLEMPAFGDMPERMLQYELSAGKVDMEIMETDLLLSRWEDLQDINLMYYMETCQVFYTKLLRFQGMMLHASAVVIDGLAYIFSGPSGMGKSTHAGLYLKSFGRKAEIINDDKPALRRIDGVWYAYGTPWCGKDDINSNEKAEIAGICFLRRGDQKITRLKPQETIAYIMAQTHRFVRPDEMRILLPLVDKLAREVPIFEFYNHADPNDALLTYSVMKDAYMRRDDHEE